MSNATNTFFTKQHFENEIRLDVNEDVLKRIYDDDIKSTDLLPINFFFVTDTKGKAIIFKKYLENSFPDYNEIGIGNYKGNFEIRGYTNALAMELKTINQWNQIVWDVRYAYDCVLDGWEVKGN